MCAATRPRSLPAAPKATGGFGLSGIGSTGVDLGADYDDGRKDESAGGDIEKYAQDNLNLNCGRPKGLRLLFRKKFSVRDILSWSKDPIPQPMLAIVDGEKLLKREACNLFRLVQVGFSPFSPHTARFILCIPVTIGCSVFAGHYKCSCDNK